MGNCYPVNARPSEMMETLSQRYGTGMVGLLLCHFDDFSQKLLEVFLGRECSPSSNDSIHSDFRESISACQ